MAREVKKGITFFPTVDTEFDKMGDASKFGLEIVNANNGAVVTNAASGTWAEVMWTNPDHSATTAGVATAGSSTINVSTSDLTLVPGDRFDDGAGNLYYVTAVDTSAGVITIKGKLVADIDDDTDLNSVGNTGIYKVDVQIDTEGEYLVNISHPDFGHSTVKYIVVANTIDDVYSRLDGGLNSLGATTTMKVIA